MNNRECVTRRWRFLLVLALLPMIWALCAAPAWAQGPPRDPWRNLRITDKETAPLFLPLQWRQLGAAREETCQPLDGVAFDVITVPPPPTDRPPAEHADLNLALRGYVPVAAHLGYVWLDGPTDKRAPQLHSLFAKPRLPEILETYQVYDWNWDCNCRTEPLDKPEVTLISMAAEPGETLHTPTSGYTLGNGYQALVLFAQPDAITLKYTREDNVVIGYTVHLEGVCVASELLALYHKMDVGGRSQLPALKPGQPFARARGGAVKVAIRDSGRFMDPRSLKDWWRGLQ